MPDYPAAGLPTKRRAANRPPGLERMALHILVCRDPKTGRFTFESRVKQDFDDALEDVLRQGSPTRYVYSITGWLMKALGHFEALLAARWDDELALELLDVDEASTLLRQPME